MNSQLGLVKFTFFFVCSRLMARYTFIFSYLHLYPLTIRVLSKRFVRHNHDTVPCILQNAPLNFQLSYFLFASETETHH